MNKLVTYMAVSVLAVVASCIGGSREYTGYNEIPASGWPYGESCDYTVSTGDSLVSGMVFLSITHDNSYEYSNLWVEVTYDEACGKHHVDTVNVVMCDELGNWYGKGLPGHYQLTDTLVGDIVTLSDSARLSVRHIMRVDTLPGISQVGIRLEPI